MRGEQQECRGHSRNGISHSDHKISGAKDAIRIVPYFVLPQFYPIFAYRGIVIPLLCSYWGGFQGLSPTYEQAHVGLDLLTLASLHTIIAALSSSYKSQYYILILQ